MTAASLDLRPIEESAAEDFIVWPLSLAEREPAPPVPSGTLTTEKVPAAHSPQPIPLIRLVLPLVMLVMVGGMIAVMLTMGGPPQPMMLMFPVMLLLSMATMFAGPPGEDIDETRRAFLRHLGAVRKVALRNAADQRAAEVHKHPDPTQLWTSVGSRRMWERRADDPDALEVRVGLGVTALCTPVVVADSGALEDLDPVCAVSLRHVVRSVGSVANMPVAVQLQAFRFVGLSGPYAVELARAMVLQLIFHHGPDCVGISVRGDALPWLKWAPHTRNIAGATFRVLVLCGAETTMHPDLDDPTWTTILAVDLSPTSELGELVLSEGLFLSVGAGEQRTLTVHTEGGLEDIGSADQVTEAQSQHCCRLLTAFRRPDSSPTRAKDFLGLHGITDIRNLDPASLWSRRRPAPHHLNVPIGLTDAGQALYLDIKESAHGGVGPHGLCIGSTGSGKSELLKTFVLSLAISHSPEELNFVLVDFKGGATFLELDQLPHTSAVITNLSEEASLVERMHDAISGELNRRQEVLRAAGNFANVAEYNDARLDTRPELPPLPALVIVLDEFSELLGKHPDFAELFVAVGRLGRSLGMHLLLASQRLEEGRLRGLDSHLSYRIGLKTFSAAESRQVLGVPDAYHLPAKPGAGFIKSDANDVTGFQASYVSGPLPTRSQTPHHQPRGVTLFTGFEAEDSATAEQQLDHSTTVLNAVVAVIKDAGEHSRCHAHQLWLPPLPDSLPLANVADQVGHLSAAIGVVDRPFLQRQDPFILTLEAGSGHVAICGAPQTGKSNALRSLVLSLAATHHTDHLRVYVLDLAGTELAALAALPHVAAVAHRHETEKVARIVAEVGSFIASPEQRHTFLVVDGWHCIASDFEELHDALVAIAADGLSANVHLVVSAARWSLLRPSIRDMMVTRIELKLGEALDSLISRDAQLKLVDKPGRGLSTDGEMVLIAHSTNQDVGHVIMAAKSQGMAPVPRLRMLPEKLQLSEVGSAPGLLFGIGGPALGPLAWQPETAAHVLCIGAQGSGKSTFLRTVGEGVVKLGREHARLVVIDPRRSHLGTFPDSMVAAYGATADSIAAALANTAATLRGRLPGPDITAEQLKARSWWSGPELYVLIDDSDLISDVALHPLVEFLPHARDIGLHVVLARKAGGINRALYSGLYAAVKDGNPAVLLLDADPEEGRILGIKPIKQIPGRGTWMVVGSVVGACHVAQCDLETGVA